MMPSDCARYAINEAGSAEFPFCVEYRVLAAADDNDIEVVADQFLPTLLWQQEPDVHIPGTLFLYKICRQVFELVIFFFFNT
jgi:hypothetical protein